MARARTSLRPKAAAKRGKPGAADKPAKKPRAAASKSTAGKPRAAASKSTAGKPRGAARKPAGKRRASASKPAATTLRGGSAVVTVLESRQPIEALRKFLAPIRGAATMEQGQIALGSAQLMLLPIAHEHRGGDEVKLLLDLVLARWDAFPDRSGFHAQEFLRNAFAAVGDDRERLARLTALVPPDATSELRFNMAAAHAVAGDRPAMLRALEAALAAGATPAQVRRDPDLARFVDDPALAALLDRAGEDPRPTGEAVGDPTPRDIASLVDRTGEDPRPTGEAVGDPTPRDIASLVDRAGEDPRPAGEAVGDPTPRDIASLVDRAAAPAIPVDVAPHVGPVRAALDSLIEALREIGGQSRLQPPASLEAVLAAERAGRIQLPNDYRALLTISDGVALWDHELFGTRDLRGDTGLAHRAREFLAASASYGGIGMDECVPLASWGEPDHWLLYDPRGVVRDGAPGYVVMLTADPSPVADLTEALRRLEDAARDALATN